MTRHRVSGQIARRAFEVDQPTIVKAISEKAVHVAVDEIADEHLWSTVSLESPQAVMRRLAWAQIGHREHRVSDGHALATLDDSSWKPPGRRPLLSKHRPENLFLCRVVTANHLIHTRDGVHGNVCIAQESGDTSVVIRMRVRDDDRGERLVQRLDA